MPGSTQVRTRTFAASAATVIALVFVAVGCGSEGGGGKSATATSTADTKSTQDAIRAAERARLHALLTDNLDAARKLHADDFELINPSGETISREAYIDSGAAFAYTKWTPITPIRVRVHGYSAVIRYKSDLEISGYRGHIWHTDLYEKRKGEWQIVWSQATQAP